MKNHTKVYIKSLGYHNTDFMPCEISGQKGIDIHHIVDREDRIENLMLLTRELHKDLGEVKSKTYFLLEIHMQFLELSGVKFDVKWFNEQMQKYEAYIND